MFDVDKLYTYMYATKEIIVDKEKSKEFKAKLKEYYTKDQIEARNQFGDIVNILNSDIELTEDQESMLIDTLNSIKEAHNDIKEIKSWLKNNIKIVKDEEKSLFNDLLDIHLAVFKNGSDDLYRLIMAPNGFGQLKTGKTTGLGFDIERLKDNANKNRLNYLSPEYQQMKFLNGTSGKQGVGIFSSLSMFNSITQGKELRYVNKSSDSDRSVFSVTFGNEKSNGELGLLKTINGKYFTSKVIEAFQSASVDNEKEQILYKLNINKYTAPVINALAVLGFDEETICYFINQPIIEYYTEFMASKDSSLNDFDPDAGANVFDKIENFIIGKYNITDIDNSLNNSGVDVLKEQIATKEQNRSKSFWEKQLGLLRKFEEINEVGNSVQALMQTVNAESKGLGKTLFGSLSREDKINDIDDVTERYNSGKSATGIINAGRILYEFNEDGEYTTNEFNGKITDSLNGFVAEYGTKILNNIGSQIFPYRKKPINDIFDYLRELLGKKGSSISQDEDFMGKTFTAMKSYLFSNTNLYGDKVDLKAERKRLFLGEYKLLDPNNPNGEAILVNPSLADTIEALKNENIGKSNMLLRMLTVDKRMTSSAVKLVKYNAASGQNADESEIHQAFIALFRENVPLEYKIGDKINKINSRDLALDLIKYTYLSGGSQEAIQFTRYIPIDVLEYIGFGDRINTIAKNISLSHFGTSVEKNSIKNSNFVEQYLQHNPSKVPVKIKGKLNKGNKDLKNVQIKDGIVWKFTPNFTVDTTKGSADYMLGQKYVVGMTDNMKYLIYKFNGTEFVNIPTLGTFGMSEYDFNLPSGEVAQSVITSRNITPLNENKPSDISNKLSQQVKQEELDVTKEYDLYKNSLDNENQIKGILELISKNGNEANSRIAKKLLENTHLLNSISDYNLSYGDVGRSSGRHNMYDKTITISNIKNKFKSKDKLENTLVHEIVHAYTVRTLRLIFDDKFKSENIEEFENLDPKIIESARRIRSIRRALVYKAKSSSKELSDKLKDIEAWWANNKTTKLTEEHKFAYSLSDDFEFVSMALTDSSFRSEIDKLDSISDNNSTLKKL